MAKFKVAVSYRNSCCEEIIEIEAESAEKARKRCSEIVEENKAMIDRCIAKGIYVSRAIADCRLHNMHWSLELVQCMNMTSESEKEV